MNSSGPLIETTTLWCRRCRADRKHQLNYAFGGDSTIESWRCALCHTGVVTKDGEP
jgi:hypothetical protein